MEKRQWSTFRDRLMLKAREKTVPIAATFELSPLCNFSCKMCYVHLSQKEQESQKELIAPDKWIEIAKRCKEAGTIFLTLTGGEVFFYKDFLYLYETLYDMGFMISILSNGYLINDEVMAVLKRKPPFRIRVTMYGASDKTYQNVCGVSNGYTKVAANVLKLKNNGMNISIAMTAIIDNKDDVSKVQKWATENKMRFVSNCRISLPQRVSNEFAKKVRIVGDDYVSLHDTSKVICKKEIQRYINNPFEDCRCYRTTLNVTWTGRMLGCLSICSVSEDALSGDITENFHNLWERLSQIRMPQKCRECNLIDYCVYCPGTLAAESGDPEKVNPYVCAMANWVYDDIHRESPIQNNECLEE